MITLYTAATPNGHKASIMLEEAGIPYEVKSISLGDNEQKEPWFLKLNPNGRIPVIVDSDNDHFSVFESGAILLYLAEKSARFLPEDPKQRSRVLQWLMFQMGGLGPMQGQANVFFRYASEKIPFAISRYQHETRRLYEVLDKGLAGKDFLVDEVSIADFAMYPWVRVHEWAGVSVEGLEHLGRWMERMAARPGVVRGLDVPVKLQPIELNAEKIAETARKMLVT